MTPPRLARQLLWHALPAHVRQQAVGDLDEECAGRAATHGAIRVHVWYWRQALASLPFAWQLRRQARHRRISPGPRASILADAIRDIRHGVRLLGRQRLLAASTTITIGLGIAASTSVFTITRAVLLKALPYADPDALVSVGEYDTRREASNGALSWPDFLEYRDRAQTLAGIAGYSGGSRTILGAGAPDQVAMTEVTAGFWEMLGVRPTLGRTFVDEDFVPSADGASISMMVTDAAWRRRFGGDHGVIGRRIDLAGQPAVVIGVLPSDFEFPLRGLAEIWLPIWPSQAQRERRYFHWLDVIARVRPGVSMAAAEAELKTMAAGFAGLDPSGHPAATVRLRLLSDQIIGGVRPIVAVLLGAAGVLLVIACANIAGLLIARGLGRAREMGLRWSIGASSGRLVRQLLAESLAFAVPGAIVGVAAGALVVRRFVEMLPLQQRVSLPHLDEVGLDPVALVVSVAVALLAAVVCGIAPAWQAARQGGAGVLRARGPAPRETRVPSAFVATQVALTLVLVAATALLGRSTYALLAVSPGFEPDGLLTFRVAFPPTRRDRPTRVAPSRQMCFDRSARFQDPAAPRRSISFR